MRTTSLSPGRKVRSLVLLLLLWVSAPSWSLAQVVLADAALSDTLYAHRGLRFGVAAEAFFYNAEFDHPLKVGYTLPGWTLVPELAYHYGRHFCVMAGWHAAQMMGLRGAWRNLPLLRVASSPIDGLNVTMGALRPDPQHGLPDYAYSPQYRWLERPELGVQIDYAWRRWKGEVWIDWENFIWRGAAENERFLFGARAVYGVEGVSGLLVQAFLLAHHSGGQIDATTNPVVTSTNMGANLAYSWALGTSLLRLGAGGVQSRDGRKASPFAGKKGWALRSEAAWSLQGLTLSLAYFYAKRFYTLRGEELYAAYSSWSDGRSIEQRHLLTPSASYHYTLRGFLRFGVEAVGHYDFSLRRIDWFFALATSVNLNFWALSQPLHR